MNSISYIEKLADRGLICDFYHNRVLEAKNKKQLFELCAEPDGMEWMLNMRKNGIIRDMNSIIKDFSPFINGRYCPSYHNDNGEYTSSIYCGLNNEDIYVETTNVLLLWCNNCTIHLKEYSYTFIGIDGENNVIAPSENAKFYMYE